MVSSVRPLAKPKYILRLLPTDKLVPTPDNSRRPITQASVESLARSIRRDGVLFIAKCQTTLRSAHCRTQSLPHLHPARSLPDRECQAWITYATA